MTDTSKQGTGDELGRIEVGSLGEIVFEDDGDHDACYYVIIEYEAEDGSIQRKPLARGPSAVRERLGDSAFMDALDAAGSDRSTTARLSDDDNRGPPAFKCKGCNRTWPRSANQNPGSGDDLCPECADEAGD